MKTRIQIFILLSATAVFAGTVCFDIPAGPPTQRVAAAYGDMLNLVDANGSPRPANQQEVSNACSAWVQQTTQDYERRTNMAQFTPSPLPISTSTPAPTAAAAAAKKP